MEDKFWVFLFFKINFKKYSDHVSHIVFYSSGPELI